jgi:hypothetical protein
MNDDEQPERGPACPVPSSGSAIDACRMLYTVRKPQTGPCFQKLLLHQLA